MNNDKDVTALLQEIKEGKTESYEQLFQKVYNQLKRIAGRQLNRESNDITVTETELVHELYLKMVDQSRLKAVNRSHFLAIAARCMRQILVDKARQKKAAKRGGDNEKITLADEFLKVREESEDTIVLDEKLKELEQLDKRLAEVVTLRFFGRMTFDDTAKALNISKRTAKRDWAKARGWLYKELRKN